MSSVMGSPEKARKVRSLRATHGDVCWCCGDPIDFTLPRTDAEAGTLDHIVPRYLGGTNELTNLRLAHSACNAARGRWQCKQAQAA